MMTTTLEPRSETLTVTRADYADAEDAAAVVRLLDLYARDPMGGASPLSQEVRDRLVAGLAATGNAFSVIARIDGDPVGLANCFFGFSTFAARPLVNIHDMVVDARFRGRGIGRALFAEIEAIAVSRGACKVTLEVLSGNAPARALYASLGYGDYALDPETGAALFWQKRLDA
jgi:ribosomal protein S18 acetylase RimI-like enzyme